MPHSDHLRLAAARRAGRRGFSFIEVMFAVIILGIGFVMVSAMFPVAIQQTQMNVEDAAVGRVNLLAQQSFTALKQDLVAQTHINTIRTNYPNGVINNLYYGWPISLGAGLKQQGKLYSFRDPRAISYPLLPAPSPTPIPIVLTNQYQFFLNSLPPGVGHPLGIIGLWERVRGNLISSAEPQYACVPMFQRGNSATSADSQVNIYCFLATARNRTPYTYTANAGVHSDVFRNPGEAASDTMNDSASPPAVLEPRLISVRLHVHGDTADPAADPILDTIDLTNEATSGQVSSPAAAGTGGFVVISDDNPPPGTLNSANAGVVNGAILRLGAQRTANSGAQFTYELQPGADFSALSGPQQIPFLTSGVLRLAYIDAFILGRELRDPNSKYDAVNNPYDGPVQDLTVQQFPISIPNQ